MSAGQKLTYPQLESLKRIRAEVGGKWFTVVQCYGLSVRRPEFTLETLHKKGFLFKEANPNWTGPLLDDYYRYKIVPTIREADILYWCDGCGGYKYFDLENKCRDCGKVLV